MSSGDQSNPESLSTVTDATVGTFTLASSSYKYDSINLSGGTAGTVTLPDPGSAAGSYYKTIINTSGVTKTLTDGHAAQPVLTTGFLGRYLCDMTGMHAMATPIAYP
mgnify:CR=1 FL=1